MERVLTKNFDIPESHTLQAYEKTGGYSALKKALGMKPEEVTEEVKNSGLRGRGGAGFPAGMKWSFVPKNTGKAVYLCVNADEGEPGTFKDRAILEKDPHLMIEGTLIASYAIGAKTAYVYVRGEFDLPTRRLEAAVKEAYAKGYAGKNILGTGYDCELFVHRGAGAYICGEETALLNSLEGNRGYPRIKPPFPAVEGLFKCPTVVNNVETLAAVPYIIENGAAGYKRIGTEKSPGTKLFSVSGPVMRPGVYEVEMGYPMRKFLHEDVGWMRPGKVLKAVIPGGSSMPVLTAQEVEEVNLDYESIAAKGSLLGSGGMIVIDEDTCMVWALENLARFYSHESCGQCSPCREGTGWSYKILKRMVHGESKKEDIDLLLDIGQKMAGKTICVLADSLSMPIASYIGKFREEFEAHTRGACEKCRKHTA
jgi:NADH-quinone oxidoreductase subunit F